MGQLNADDPAARSGEVLSQARELADGWNRGGDRITIRDGLTASILGLGYAVTTLLIAARAGEVRGIDLVTLLVLVGLYTVAYYIEFEGIWGSAVPTTPVLVAMLFLLPKQLVPLTVLVALVLAPSGGEREPGPLWRTMALRSLSGWHCIGPVIVLWDRGPATLDDWPMYVTALAAQLALDLAVSMTRAVIGLGLPARTVFMGWVMPLATDVLLAPIGVAAVIAAKEHRAATFILIGCPVLLMWLVAHDRKEAVDRSLMLGQAVVEATEQARIDVLTRVGNRRAWQEALEQAERFVAAEPGRAATMALVDLDELKLTNDTLGHAAGDLLIAAAGELLLATAPEDATVARIGGDEFAVLIVGLANEIMSPDALAESIRRAIFTRPPVGDTYLKASVGAASSPPAPTVGIAAQWADAGIYAEKASHRRL